MSDGFGGRLWAMVWKGCASTVPISAEGSSKGSSSGAAFLGGVTATGWVRVKITSVPAS